MRQHPRLVQVAFVAALVALGLVERALDRTASLEAQNDLVDAPKFEVDPNFPKPLPNHWQLGETIGVDVDAQDHVWIVHRADQVVPGETGLDQNPPTSTCCAKAPPILEFDQAGNVIKHWGGPSPDYEWPQSNHGITIDYKGIVWIGGNVGPDSQLLKFTQDGKFLAQYGHSGKSTGSNDTENFGRPAKIFVDPKNNEAYIADGYGNKRVAVIDADTGKFKRYWGAYGNKPDDTNTGRYNPDAPPIQQFRSPVHCAMLSVDRLVYVCDRPNDRIQVFTEDGKFVKEVVHQEEDARRRLGVGHRVLEGSAAEVPVPRGRQEREGLHHAARHARDPHELRRRRPSAGTVLRRAQHRDRLEGQPLHDGDLPGPPAAEVRVQGRAEGAQGPGRRVAQEVNSARQV